MVVSTVAVNKGGWVNIGLERSRSTLLSLGVNPLVARTQPGVDTRLARQGGRDRAWYNVSSRVILVGLYSTILAAIVTVSYMESRQIVRYNRPVADVRLSLE